MLDCKRNACANPLIGTKTQAMIQRVKRGLPAYDPKPDGLEAISYAVFFDSMFELADAWVSETGVVLFEARICCKLRCYVPGPDNINAESYSAYLLELLPKIIISETDSNGDTTYRSVCTASCSKSECVYAN